MAIPKLLEFENYNRYPTDSNPTTDADMQDYLGNQNNVLKNIVKAFLWQPSTTYLVNQMVFSPNLPAGYAALCVTTGASGTTEPVWGNGAGEITDGGVKWKKVLVGEEKLAKSNVVKKGSATQPVYFDSNGVATACTYNLNKSVPSDAKFTDTTYSPATQSAQGLMSASDKKKLDGIEEGAKAGGDISVGMIIPFAGNGDIPVGFLLCNGASVGRTTYPDLFAAIGTTYGAADDAHFNLPNLTDKFIEGASVAGGNKEAGLPNITGYWTAPNNWNNSNYIGGYGGLVKSCTNASAPDLASSSWKGTRTTRMDFDASNSNPIYGNSDTVQPPALTMRYIIKAFAGASSDSTDVAITNLANDLVNLQGHIEGITDCIVDSGKSTDGTIWYRKWKSGWLEQGGHTSATQSMTITFVKRFVNTDYNVQITCLDNNSDQNWAAKNRTVSDFLLVNSESFAHSWYTCGQGA